jgi:hypothetical protein
VMRATARREHREHREREVGRRGRRCEPGRGVQGCFTRTRPGVKGATPRAHPIDERFSLMHAIGCRAGFMSVPHAQSGRIGPSGRAPMVREIARASEA